MSIEQARTCERCQRANRREDKICTQCGADLRGDAKREALHEDQELIAAGLTIALFVIVPILIVLYFDVDAAADAESFGFASIAVALYAGVFMAVCAGVLLLVKELVGPRNRSVARGIRNGILAGLLLGVASCTGSLVVFY